MWIFGLCVTLLISAALLILLLPMLGQRQSKLIRLLDQSLAAGIIDTEQHTARRAQLENAQTEPAKPSLGFRILLVIAIPAAALLLYFQVGSPEALDPERRIPASGTQGVQQLQQSLENDPDNLEGWLTLGGTLVSQQRFSEAVPAYQQALQIIPEDRPERAVVMADIAEAMIFSSGSQEIPAAARNYLEQAITIDPQLQRGLWLLGVVAFQDGDYDLAIERWQRLLPLVESNTVRQSVQEQIAQAQARLAGIADPAPVNPAQQPASDTRITVNVSLASELSAQLAQQAGPPILFVFARITGSQQPPVAIKRLPLANMPLTVNLTEADAMLPGNSLATLATDSPLQITARISFSGNAIAQPGDWEGQTETTIGADSTVLPLLIDRVVGQQ